MMKREFTRRRTRRVKMIDADPVTQVRSTPHEGEADANNALYFNILHIY